MATKLRILMTRHGVDMLVVAVIVGGVVEVIATRGESGGPRGSLAALIACMLAITVPLLFWRVAPVAVSMTVLAIVLAISFVESQLATSSGVCFIAVLTASFLLGMANQRSQAFAGLAFALAGLSLVIHNDHRGTGVFFSIALMMTMAWLAGFTLQQKRRQVEAAEQRAVRLERERELLDFEAAAEERARIARELHDVIAHSVSVMTVQAGAVRRLLHSDQERERDALEVIAQTGREALAEMRRLVGVMKRPEESPALAPQPSLQYLDRLAEHVREAGLEVRLEIEGEPIALPVGIDVSAYRIVQEGLTNTLKHARATSVDVLVRYGAGVVELVVSDDGRANTNSGGGGHGLVGMRERVAVYGGEIMAGPREGGGYELRARLPVDA